MIASDFRHSGSFVVLVFLFLRPATLAGFRLSVLLLLIRAFAATITVRGGSVVAVGWNLRNIDRHRVERLEVLLISTKTRERNKQKASYMMGRYIIRTLVTM